jgi:hypothetical protein
MLAGPVAGLSLLIAVAIEPPQPSPDGTAARLQMSTQQKDAVIAPLMRLATDCIVRAVAANPKFNSAMPPGDINVLIAQAMAVCIGPMRAMIEAHDRLYGQGSGRAFFMGPYLDTLPAAVTRQVRDIP